MRQISVLIIGLGRMGGRFFDKLSAAHNDKVKIVGVCETKENNPIAQEAISLGIPYYKNYEDAINELGESIDIIMDTSNRPEIKQAIRKLLQETDNYHTVLIPLVVDYLMWYMLPGEEQIPQDHLEIGY